MQVHVCEQLCVHGQSPEQSITALSPGVKVVYGVPGFLCV